MNTNRHWQDQELIDLFYGLRSRNAHLRQCPECAKRLEALEERRQLTLDCAVETPVNLEAQRAQTLERIRKHALPQPWHRRWQFAASLAATVVLAAILLLTPREEPTTLIAYSDQQLFQEIHELVVTAEPDAVSSIRFMFAEATDAGSAAVVNDP